jgi:hypothetical protein
LMTLHGQFEQNIGFLVAEHYDFGSAELINGLFRDLITVSPFTKSEGNQLSVTKICGSGANHAARSSRWLSACSGTGTAL